MRQLTSYLTVNLPRTTATYNSITNKMTFVNSVNEFKILTGFSSCQNLLGVSTDDLYNTSIGCNLTSAKMVNTAQTRMINSIICHCCSWPISGQIRCQLITVIIPIRDYYSCIKNW